MGFLGWEFTKEKKSVCGKRLEISYRRKGQDTQRGGRVKIACVFYCWVMKNAYFLSKTPS
jgi:hypothetical protein